MRRIVGETLTRRRTIPFAIDDEKRLRHEANDESIMDTNAYNAAKREVKNAELVFHALIRRDAPPAEVSAARARLRTALKQFETLLKDATPEQRSQASIDSSIILRKDAP